MDMLHALTERVRKWIAEESTVPGDVRQMAARGDIDTFRVASSGKGSSQIAKVLRRERQAIQNRTAPDREHPEGFVSNLDPSKPLTRWANHPLRVPEPTFGDASVAYAYPYGETILLPEDVSFIYCNAEGNTELRSATAYRTYYAGGRAYLEAHDHARKDTRTFRLDRIEGGITRLESGEIVSARDWFASTAPTRESKSVRDRSSSSVRSLGWQTAVFFAGFHETRRWRLEEQAEAAGWDVRGHISRTVNYVVAGPLAGPKQLARAEDLGIPVIDEESFNLLV